MLYQPLAGVTLRDLLKQDAITPEICSTLGAFVALLHQKGIYFRSLHFGNILLMPNQQIGLIDIADMNIYWWRLNVSTRVRNFLRIQKYHDDMLKLGQDNRLRIMDAYIARAGLSNNQCNRLLNRVRYEPHLSQSEY